MSGPLAVNTIPGELTTSRNINTVLLWVTCSVSGFIAVLCVTTAIQLAFLKGSMESRQEIDAKIAQVNAYVAASKADSDAKMLSLDKDLTALKLALAERGLKTKY